MSFFRESFLRESFFKDKACLISFIFFSFSALFSFSSQGEKLNSPYISMFVSKGWICMNLPPNHICHPKEMPRGKQIFVLISAKMGLKSDRLPEYLSSYQGFQEVKDLTLNSHKWLDFLPDNRSNYAKRSLVTICCDEFNYTFHTRVGFYVTRLAYPEYASLIVRMINSLNLNKRNAKQIEEMLKNQDPRDLDKLQNYIGEILSEEEAANLGIHQKQEGSSLLWYLLLILALALPFFLFIKRRRKKRKLKALKKKTNRKGVRNV